MAVRWKKISLPFRGGVDTKSDHKTVPPTKLTLLENGVFTKGGSIIKRNGYGDLDRNIYSTTLPPPQLSSAKGLATRDNELVTFDGDKIYSYSENADAWVDKGFYKPVTVSTRAVFQENAEQTLCDFAELNGVAVYAWEDSRGSIRIAAEDTSTSAIFNYGLSPAGITGSRPRLVVAGDHILVFFADATNEKLKCLPVNTYDVASSFAGTSISSVHDLRSTDVGYDICEHSSTEVIVAYYTRDNTIKVVKVGTDGVLSYPPGAFEFLPPVPYTEIDSGVIACGYTDKVIVLFADTATNALNGFSVAEDWTEDVGEVALSASSSDVINNVTFTPTPEGETDEWDVYFERAGTSNYLNYVESGRMSHTGGTLTLSEAVFKRHSSLGTKSWTIGQKSYVGLVHDSTLQSTYFVLDVDGNIVARVLPGSAGGSHAYPFLPQVVNASGDTYAFPAVYKKRLEQADLSTGDVDGENPLDSSVYTEKSIKRVELDFDNAEAHHSCQLGRSLYLNGGMLFEYDGESCVESGFLLYPENIAVAESNTAGANLDVTAQYNYRVYWEWTNAQGEREQSTCAAIVSFTLTGANDTLRLTIPTLSFTSKDGDTRSDVHLAIYRTEGNLSDLYYRVTSHDPSDSTYLENDPSVDTIDFTDDQDDGSITTNELDYQNTLELDNVNPATPSVIAAAKDRVFIAGGELPESEVYHSKLHAPEDAAEFNDALLIRVDRDGGPVTGMGILNGSLVVFKEDRIFIVTGAGPDNLGYGAFSEAQQIASDVGCKTQKSIVITPLGLMFQSDKGIFLLDQRLMLHYIGAEVETYNSQTITAATLLQDTNQIVFLTSSGHTLVYDYFFKQWSTFTNHEGVGAVNWDDTYAYMRSTGQCMKQDSTYTDAGAAYRLRTQTAWIKFGGLQNFARVRSCSVLGEFNTHHVLNMSIGYDYEPGFKNLKTFTTSNVINQVSWGDGTWGSGYWGGSGTSVYQFKAYMPRQKCEAIRFLFEDNPGEIPGQGYEITELGLVVGLKKSGFKLGSSKVI